MIVRPYTESDLEEVKALHKKQGLDYVLPDLEAQEMLVRCVIEENGEITDAAFLRKTAETYWIFDPKASRKERMQRLIVLHKEMDPVAARVGLSDHHAWIDPTIVSKSMERTMFRLGYQKPLWTCYSRKVNP